MADVSNLPSVSLSQILIRHHTTCDECDGSGALECEVCPGCDGDGEGGQYWPDFCASDIDRCTSCKPNEDGPVMGCGVDNEERFLCRACWIDWHKHVCGCGLWSGQ